MLPQRRTPQHWAWCWLFTIMGLGWLAATTNANAQEKEATKLNLHISAARGVNPDETRRPAPIKVRVYELADSASFKDADYFSLDGQDKVVLAADMLARDEFILRPREQQTIQRKSNPKTTAIGILAGYRDLPKSVWRVVVPLQEAPEKAWYRAVLPANSLELDIQLQPQGITVVPLQ